MWHRREQCGSPATTGWVAGGEIWDSPGNKLLRAVGARVTAGSLARCLLSQMCPLPSPFPSHGVQGGLDGGIRGRSRAAATGVGQEGQVPRWTKPAAHRSLVMANQNHWHPWPQRSKDFLPSLTLWSYLRSGHSSP